MPDSTPALPSWWPPALGFVALLILVDIAIDWSQAGELLHIALESLAGVAVLGVLVGILRRGQRRVGRLTRDLAESRLDAEQSRQDAEHWRTEAEQILRGLGAAIDVQFSRWGLTPAEREVGLLLLKGLSMSEVADVRSTSERTARDQARAIYRKAGVSGRAELSAFFLEDLLVAPVNQA